MNPPRYDDNQNSAFASLRDRLTNGRIKHTVMEYVYKETPIPRQPGTPKIVRRPKAVKR